MQTGKQREEKERAKMYTPHASASTTTSRPEATDYSIGAYIYRCTRGGRHCDVRALWRLGQLKLALPLRDDRFVGGCVD